MEPNPDSSFPQYPPLEILLEDGPVFVVNKPAGLLTLGGKTGVPTLERQVKADLKARFEKPGNVYLGIPHRLDRPVSGVIVFARNSKVAARLAEQFRERQVRKIYWAFVEPAPDPPDGVLVHWLVKETDRAHVHTADPRARGAREARLCYRTLERSGPGALLEIELETGRMHQIRVQLADQGWHIVGDSQYGATRPLVALASAAADDRGGPIALHAQSLTFLHPIRYDAVTVTAPLPQNWRTLELSVGPASTEAADSAP